LPRSPPHEPDPDLRFDPVVVPIVAVADLVGNFDLRKGIGMLAGSSAST
jgi:hypothetical protein